MAEKKTNLCNNPFAPIDPADLAPQCEPIVYPETQIDYVLVPYSKEVDGDPENVVIEYKVVKKAEYKTADYINSFADDVGIQNILKKLSLSGDRSLLNQTGREALCPDGGLEPVQDYTTVPANKTEAFNAVVAGVNAFDQLPEDIKGKMSMSQFVELFGQDQFNAYIQSVVEKSLPKEDK